MKRILSTSLALVLSFGNLTPAHAQAIAPTLSQNVVTALTNLITGNGGSNTTIASIVYGPRPDGITLASTVAQLFAVYDAPPVLDRLLRENGVPMSYTLYQAFVALYNITQPNPSATRMMLVLLEKGRYQYQQQLQSSSTTSTTVNSSTPSGLQLCGGQLTASAVIGGVPVQGTFDMTTHTLSVATEAWTNTWTFNTPSGQISGTATLMPTQVYTVQVAGEGWVLAGQVSVNSPQVCPASAQVSLIGTGSNPNCASATVDSGTGKSLTVNVTNAECDGSAGLLILSKAVTPWFDTLIEMAGTFLDDLQKARATIGDEGTGGEVPVDGIPGGFPAGIEAPTPSLPQPVEYTLNPSSGAGSLENPYQPGSNGTLTWHGVGYYNITNSKANGNNPAGVYYVSNAAFIATYDQNILIQTPAPNSSLPIAGPLSPQQATQILSASNGSLCSCGTVAIYSGPGIYVGSDSNLYQINSAAEFAYIKSLPAPAPPPPPPPPPPPVTTSASVMETTIHTLLANGTETVDYTGSAFPANTPLTYVIANQNAGKLGTYGGFVTTDSKGNFKATDTLYPVGSVFWAGSLVPGGPWEPNSGVYTVTFSTPSGVSVSITFTVN
jgi:hypothetical protein